MRNAFVNHQGITMDLPCDPSRPVKRDDLVDLHEISRHLPGCARWLARDKDGTWNWYVNDPESALRDEIWGGDQTTPDYDVVGGWVREMLNPLDYLHWTETKLELPCTP